MTADIVERLRRTKLLWAKCKLYLDAADQIERYCLASVRPTKEGKMTDVVERLRAPALNLQQIVDERKEAADEIERLRQGWKKEADKDCKWALKEIERLEAEVSDWKDHSLKQSDEIERLSNALAISGEEGDAHIEEIKRLHAVLKKITETCAYGDEMCDALEIARRALEGK